MSAYPSTTTCVSTAPTAVQSTGKGLVVIEKTFDLDTLLSAKLANADIVNLFTLPAGFCVLATRLATTVASVGGTSTCTLTLRFGTTNIGAATNILAEAVGTGGNATVSLPLTVGTSDVLCNVVCALGGGTTTLNPTIHVTVVGLQMV